MSKNIPVTIHSHHINMIVVETHIILLLALIIMNTYLEEALIWMQEHRLSPTPDEIWEMAEKLAAQEGLNLYEIDK